MSKDDTQAMLERRLAAIEATIEGIGIVDADGNLTYMNSALLDLHGIAHQDKDKYIGKSWLNLYNDAGRHQIENFVLPKFEKNKAWRGRSPVQRLDGEIITVELSMTRLDDGGFIGTARDVSDQEASEREKHEMQNQLFQAQKMEAIGRLAGGIAHDFNNILAAMNGYAEFLSEDLDEGSTQQKFAHNILQAGRQARGLVDKILTFSRRHEDDVEQFNLQTPLHETVTMLEATLPKTIELRTKISGDDVFMNGNPNLMSQMIMNLCVNARDAIEGDRGSITLGLKKIRPEEDVSLALLDNKLPDANAMPLIHIEDGKAGETWLYMNRISQKHDYVCLSVEDTGGGMSHVIMQHIFEPFFTTKDTHKGTGLGLAMVHGTITAHQGALIIHSEIDKGTRFEIYLPLAEALEETQAQTKREKIAHIDGKVLLVEDQFEVLEMTTIMLERAGFEVETAMNGLEALDILRARSEEFDVVLTDQNMPKMSGIELINQAYMDFPDMPFVLLSGYSVEQLQALMKEHPAIKAIIRKPVSQKDLDRKLSMVIRGFSPRNKNAA